MTLGDRRQRSERGWRGPLRSKDTMREKAVKRVRADFAVLLMVNVTHGGAVGLQNPGRMVYGLLSPRRLFVYIAAWSFQLSRSIVAARRRRPGECSATPTQKGRQGRRQPPVA